MRRCRAVIAVPLALRDEVDVIIRLFAPDARIPGVVQAVAVIVLAIAGLRVAQEILAIRVVAVALALSLAVAITIRLFANRARVPGVVQAVAVVVLAVTDFRIRREIRRVAVVTISAPEELAEFSVVIFVAIAGATECA